MVPKHDLLAKNGTHCAIIPFMSAPLPYSDHVRPGPGTRSRPEKRNSLWTPQGPSISRAYIEIAAVLSFITIIGWASSLDYRSLGHLYLLAVIALSLRVPKWPAIIAAVISALAWNYIFIPPKMSFAVIDLEGSLLLGSYLLVALIGSQLTTRVREEHQLQQVREQQSLALLHLSRALAAAQTLDQVAVAAIEEATSLFEGNAALVLHSEQGENVRHEASTLELTKDRWDLVLTCFDGNDICSRQENSSGVTCVSAPMKSAGIAVGAIIVRDVINFRRQTLTKQDLLRGFADQVAISIERERLRQASEREALLLESERMHKILLDSVSHELKTPLAILRAASERLDTATPQRQKILFFEVQTATQRLDRLVANLLTQSRLQAGRLDAQLDWCDVRDIIEIAYKATNSALGHHPITISVPEEIPLMMADGPLMEQVLCNLLLNAAKHTPVGTAICISAYIDNENNRTCLSVRDNGPGLDPEVSSRLFKPFQRSKNAAAGGVGLGLSIVKGFMLAQGGDVEVISRPNSGATFTVWLPLEAHEIIPNDEC